MIDIFSKICYNKLTWKFMFGPLRIRRISFMISGYAEFHKTCPETAYPVYAGGSGEACC